jgi:hypothetical protein
MAYTDHSAAWPTRTGSPVERAVCPMDTPLMARIGQCPRGAHGVPPLTRTDRRPMARIGLWMARIGQCPRGAHGVPPLDAHGPASHGAHRLAPHVVHGLIPHAAHGLVPRGCRGARRRVWVCSPRGAHGVSPSPDFPGPQCVVPHAPWRARCPLPHHHRDLRGPQCPVWRARGLVSPWRARARPPPRAPRATLP